MILKFNSLIFFCLLLIIIILSALDFVDSRRGGGFRGGGGGMRGMRGGGFRGGGMRGGGGFRGHGGGMRPSGGMRPGGFRGGGMRPSGGMRPGTQRGNNFNRRPMNNFRPQQSLNRRPTNNFKPQMQRQNNFNRRPNNYNRRPLQQRQRPSNFGRPSQNQIKRPLNTQRKPINSRPGTQRQNNQNRQPQSQRINPLTQRNRPQQSRPRTNPSRSRQPQQNRRINPSRTRTRPMNNANRRTNPARTQNRPAGSTNKRIFNPAQKRIQSQNKNVRKPVQSKPKPAQNRAKIPNRNRAPSKSYQNKRPSNSAKKPMTNSNRPKTPISRTKTRNKKPTQTRVSNRKNQMNRLANKPKPTNKKPTKNINQKYKKKQSNLDLDIDSIPISPILSTDLGGGGLSPVIVQQDPIIINDPPVIVQNQPPIVINEGPQVIYDNSQPSPIYYDSDQQINLPIVNNQISCATPLIVENERIRISCRFQGSGETLKGPICLSQNSYEDSSVLFFNCKRPYVNSNADDYFEEYFNIKTCHKGDWIGEINLDCTLPAGGDNLIVNVPNDNQLVQNNNQISQNFQNPSTFVDPQSNGQTSAMSPLTTKTEDLNTPTVDGKCSILKPTRSLGVLVECVSRQNNTEISINSCEKPSIVGTEAKFKCSPYYQVIEGLGTPLRKCKEPGIWSGTSDFSCTVACGMANSVKTPFITSGLPTVRAQWPWHAAIFGKILTNSDKWVYLCGGTLIGRSAIITAAHCVTKFDSTEVQNIEDLRIDLGRYEIEIDDDEPGKGVDANVQQMTIRDIFVHPSYTPFGFDSDISIIILEKEIEISYFVRPICIPQISESTLEELQLSEGSVGTVVGWGLNENGSLSSDLKMGHLTVKSPKECTHAVKAASSGSIQSRSTTFCAGSKNQTIVCNGDSGGGSYFPSKNLENTRWYLQGVVSVGIADESGKCDPNQVSVFTRVGRYAEWIVRTLVEADIYS